MGQLLSSFRLAWPPLFHHIITSTTISNTTTTITITTTVTTTTTTTTTTTININIMSLPNKKVQPSPPSEPPPAKYHHLSFITAVIINTIWPPSLPSLHHQSQFTCTITGQHNYHHNYSSAPLFASTPQTIKNATQLEMQGQPVCYNFKIFSQILDDRAVQLLECTKILN